MFLLVFQIPVLSYLSLQDIRYKSVSLVSVIALVIGTISCLYLDKKNLDVMPALVLFVILGYLKALGRMGLKRTAIGFGDVLVLSSLALGLTIEGIAALMCLCGFLGIFAAKIMGPASRSGFAFIPVILIAYILLILFNLVQKEWGVAFFFNALTF